MPEHGLDHSEIAMEDDDENSAGSTHADGDPRSTPSAKDEKLAQRETTVVLRLRILVIAALFVTAVLVSTSIFFITRNGEVNTFKSEFEGSAKKMLDSVEEIVQQKIQAVASLSTSITAFARATSGDWPFVTVSDFQERSKVARKLSGALYIVLEPIVTDANVREWGPYSVNNSAWFQKARDAQRKAGFELSDFEGPARSLQAEMKTDDLVVDFSSGIASEIYTFDETFTKIIADPGPGPYVPVWMSSPVIPTSVINFNTIRAVNYAEGVLVCMNTSEIVIGGFDIAPPGDTRSSNLSTRYFASMVSYERKSPSAYNGDPFSSLYNPVFDSFDKETRKLVGFVIAIIKWQTYFENILTISKTITIVLEHTCGGMVTFQVTGPNASFVGIGDFHDRAYSHMGEAATFESLLDRVAEQPEDEFRVNREWCAYTIRVYPTKNFEESVTSNLPIIITCAVGFIFLFTAAMFVLYDRLVERRQLLVMNTAERSSAIVSSLFPSNVRDRLFADRDEEYVPSKSHLKNFLTGKQHDNDDGVILKTKPIADLFTDTTICFADICGFTAWSSVREPTQVFTLLETLYRAFDLIANKRHIFKVETVGDCYVAVCGLPEPCKDHAVVMARFARECVKRMVALTKRLEVTLGPDTADLGLRVGLHSGPVTAGVLRGERSRFQLFGDTMNTASRIESTGHRGRIHISKDTADLLAAAGKDDWFVPRVDVVNVKGKGVMRTYWLSGGRVSRSDGASTTGSTASVVDDDGGISSCKTARLIDWNVDTLVRLLKQIVARRNAAKLKFSGQVSRSFENQHFHETGQTVIDEVKETIVIPSFDAKAAREQEDPESIELGDVVVKQLVEFVSSIAAMYCNNPFHNFEHASHVTMSVNKLLSRIVAPSDLKYGKDGNLKLAKSVASCLHDHTYGITSDPLTQFACVLSALIHDADHPGVTNAQLVKEKTFTAGIYKNKSVAEQNSVDLAWNLLLKDSYADLRSTIYASELEMKRFRQLVVNSVMATDIMDKDLKELRNNRWDRAFKPSSVDESEQDKVNRKATIVIEHLIQASDVAHTMQHWHIYRKWNERFFTECYRAYRDGRSETDPTENWYKGEIGFFDFYIIPLAKKLKDCGVFGVSSDEYLNYAMQNRQEWEARGQEVVSAMIENVNSMQLEGEEPDGDDTPLDTECWGPEMAPQRSAVRMEF